jgi:hypothetical protein
MEQSQALQELHSLLEKVSEMRSWQMDEHAKALWFDAIVQRYKDFSAKAGKKQ